MDMERDRRDENENCLFSLGISPPVVPVEGSMELTLFFLVGPFLLSDLDH